MFINYTLKCIYPHFFRRNQNEVSCKSQPTTLQSQYEQKAIENGLAKGDYMLYKDIGSTSCYASRENSLIIYPDMSIRKCSIALDDEVNVVPSKKVWVNTL